MGISFDCGICYGVKVKFEELPEDFDKYECIEDGEKNFNVGVEFNNCYYDDPEPDMIFFAGNPYENSLNIIRNWELEDEILTFPILPNHNKGNVEEFIKKYFPDIKVKFNFYLWRNVM